MATEFPKLKSGDELTPWHLNIIYRELDRWRRLKFAGPVAYSGIDSASSPPVVTILGTGAQGRPGKASGDIAAASGDTPGTGTVAIWRYDGSTMVDTGKTEDVLNWDTL